MTREEEARQWSQLYAGIAEGKKTQYHYTDGWRDSPLPLPISCNVDNVRIKPEQKYRPWKPEEAIGKAVRWKLGGTITIIQSAAPGDAYSLDNAGWKSYAKLLESYEQPSGSPCGVLEDT